MAIVSIQNVEKRYDNGAHAVRGVSIDIQDGELLVLLGPSGCGKSTLLRMVAGLETVTEGEVQIDGKRINDISPSERDIAMVFQNYALYPHMSVYNNLAYGLRNRGVPEPDIER
ncbi:MAG TPA: sn-glycerol-3-phosphate ABC transporter ATP-binding protein UgpC, partial [Rhodospirillaceae bacterium]|nr:sn-glycerol-3-phosphate ABC transporter ATP-binding protein UgpC [Rhodospirillaceae bacterium]